MNEQRIEFVVDNVGVVGTLYLPAGRRPSPGLALDGPLTSVKEQATGNYARALAARGFVTLAIDHRYFGESDGAPRQYEHPGRKVEDVRGALTYLASRPEVDGDSLGILGVCAGAGYMARAVAEDERVSAFATVAGFFHDAAQQRTWMGAGYESALARAADSRKRYEKTGEAEMIPAVGEGDVAMPLREAFEYYGTPRGAVPNYKNEFAVMSREQTLPWDAQAAAPNIRVPTLMVHSEHALSPALARKFFAALGGPKRDLWLESKGQIDFYDDPVLISAAADALAAHFGENLGRR
jgi:fermentation-respiration switch protein FrsA (DUF1100 family)